MINSTEWTDISNLNDKQIKEQLGTNFTPNKVSYPLLAITETGEQDLSFYISDEYGNGFYNEPARVKKFPVKKISLLPDNAVVKCKICNEESVSIKLLGSPVSDSMPNQFYPCCPECKSCGQFTFLRISSNEEE